MLPNFLIIGAQKSGTTALHSVLQRHPEIYLSNPKEPMFFSRDEPLMHSFFFMQEPEMWREFDWHARRDTLIQDYSKFFSHVPAGAICGEASTTYLPSEHAPKRVHEFDPRMKIVVILRDPVNRAYSAYWHYVRKGLIIHGFENSLSYEPFRLLFLGQYQTQLENWLLLFPRKQFHVMLFERFVREPGDTINELCHFLGATKMSESYDPLDSNSARVPTNPAFQLGVNYFRRLLDQDVLVEPGRRPRRRGPISHGLLALLHRISKWNLSSDRYPPMKDSIRKRLILYYSRANRGLGQLIDQDVEQYWYKY